MTGRWLSPAVRLCAFYAYTAMAFLGAVITIVNATQGPLADSYGVAKNRISLMISCLGIGRLVIQVLCGVLSDRFGRRKLVLIGFIGMTLFFGLMPFVTTLGFGMILCMFGGIFYGMVNTTMLALVFDCYADTGRTDQAQVRVQTIYAVGGILVPMGASALIAAGISWKYLYWFCAFASLLMIAARRFVRFPPLAARTARDSGYVQEPLLKREGTLLMLAVFCLYGAHTMGLTWISALALDNTSMNQAEAVFVLSLFSLGALIGSLLIMLLIGRFSNLQLLTWLPLGACLCYAVCVLTDSAVLFRACALLAAMCTGSLFNLLVGVGGHMFPRISGTISGMMATASASASLVLPAVTGLMLDSLSTAGMYTLVFPLLLLGTALAVILRRRDSVLTGRRGSLNEERRTV